LFALNVVDISECTEREAMLEAMNTISSLIWFQIWRSNFFCGSELMDSMVRLLHILWDTG